MVDPPFLSCRIRFKVARQTSRSNRSFLYVPRVARVFPQRIGEESTRLTILITMSIFYCRVFKK